MSPNLPDTQKQEIIQGLEQIPGGRLITWLKGQLSLEDLYYASMYILDSAISQVFLIAPEEEQLKLNEMMENNQFNAFFNHIYELLDQEKTDYAAVYLSRFTEGWNLGFDVMVKKFKLNLDA
ncbi:MAG: hypothetical protein OHK0017_01700 [Patescibacteria group bacterium]